jgi:outer membrane immunogenic protein
MHRVAFALLGAVVLCAGATSSVSAQDIFDVLTSRMPVANWTGFYVGGNVGYGWAKDDSSATSSIGGASASTFTMKGLSAGGQIGANVQFSGPWVIGIETDFQASWQKFDGPANATNLTNSVGFAPPATETVRMEWFGTTRARFGYAADRVLIYGTGGVAYAVVKTNGNTGALTIINDSPVKIGWAAGGGVEVMLDRNWTLKGEYLHLDLGVSKDDYVTAGGVTASLQQKITDEIVRVGVSYLFR